MQHSVDKLLIILLIAINSSLYSQIQLTSYSLNLDVQDTLLFESKFKNPLLAFNQELYLVDTQYSQFNFYKFNFITSKIVAINKQVRFCGNTIYSLNNRLSVFKSKKFQSGFIGTINDKAICEITFFEKKYINIVAIRFGGAFTYRNLTCMKKKNYFYFSDEIEVLGDTYFSINANEFFEFYLDRDKNKDVPPQKQIKHYFVPKRHRKIPKKIQLVTGRGTMQGMDINETETELIFIKDSNFLYNLKLDKNQYYLLDSINKPLKVKFISNKEFVIIKKNEIMFCELIENTYKIKNSILLENSNQTQVECYKNKLFIFDEKYCYIFDTTQSKLLKFLTFNNLKEIYFNKKFYFVEW